MGLFDELKSAFKDGAGIPSDKSILEGLKDIVVESFKEDNNTEDNTEKASSSNTCFCGNCGNELSDDMRFCPKCGAKNGIFTDEDDDDDTDDEDEDNDDDDNEGKYDDRW
jgi:hypothetical protein